MHPDEIIQKLTAELAALPKRTTVPMRQVRRRYSRLLKTEDAACVLETAREILKTGQHR